MTPAAHRTLTVLAASACSAADTATTAAAPVTPIAGLASELIPFDKLTSFYTQNLG